ncbi:MAG TPA: hypothetical protein VIH09_03625 [Flavobacterium sp.]|uniref:hypothetical protein n=1 Tax=Flavobacterium sp. TaxID=239 RepID=UPI002F41BDBC
MNKTTILFIFLISISVYGQDFEGRIEYKLSYYQKDSKALIDSPEIIKLLGDTSIFISKKGFYKQITNSEYMAFQLYDPEENRLYFKSEIESDTLFYIVGSKIKNTKFEYEIIKNADIILGHVCDKLSVRDTIGQQDYYFANDLKVSPEYFQNFTAFNKNKITDIMKSVFLRVDYSFITFIARMEAITILETKEKDEDFVLPPHKILIEM